ncbi:hypothetical protein KSZ_49720 [Dictyobacter formicarum]|uniref:Uncharacterized protein n=1 Tax=Dictyobacter formicarum TaxID=2778368 RepID=A0ABQ3VNJ8_9CHLR|nr:hypothetical protein KSZ_49720 [Dictyobacter formicarum]
MHPASAFYHPTLCEFLLRYDDVWNLDTPEQVFLQSIYEAGATLGQRDREELERERWYQASKK